MAIVLIRHGETEGNQQRRLQFPDTPLAARGVAQAERLATRLADRSVGRILSSDYRRAEMTAHAIERATGAPLAFEPSLRERHFGALRGRTYADLGLDPFAPEYEPPGGESWEAFHARADQAFRSVVSLASTVVGDLAVVTHGLMCYSVVSRHLEIEGNAPVRFGNTSVTILAAVPPHRVSVVNCTAHLDETTADDPRMPLGR